MLKSDFSREYSTCFAVEIEEETDEKEEWRDGFGLVGYGSKRGIGQLKEIKNFKWFGFFHPIEGYGY